MLLSRSLRLTRYLRGDTLLQSVHHPPHQMGLLRQYSSLPHRASYSVQLALRRFCSSQPSEAKKPKRGRKSESKGKKQPSADAADMPAEDAETTVKKRPGRKAGGEGKKKTMAEYVSEEPAAVQNLLHQYDIQLNRQKQDPELFYILSESIADGVVEHLAGRSLDIPHLEIGPGPGVLTRRLLDAGVRRVIGFEPASVFQHCVRVLSEQTGGAVSLTPLNLMHLAKFYGAAAHGDERRVRQSLAGLEHRPWTDDPCLRVVGVAHRSRFFQFLVRSIIGREHLFQFGRPELLVFVPQAEYARLSAGPMMAGRVYRPYSILSRMLFTLEALHRVPARHFYPWMRSRKKVEFTESDMVLIRYTPKEDPGVPESELHNLDFFVRQCAVSKTRRIVPQMEEWVPGCGPRLIALGHGVFSPFRELEPEQILKLFLEFTGWPEYPACSFHAAVQQNALGGESEIVDAEHLTEDEVHEVPEHFEPEPFR